MASAWVVCQRCKELVNYSDHRMADNKKNYCKPCYEVVVDRTANKLIDVSKSLKSTKELWNGSEKKAKGDDRPIKSAKKARKRDTKS